MSRLIHARYVRHRLYSRLRRARHFLDFLVGEASRLTGTGGSATFTADNTTDTLTATAHGLAAGDGPFNVSSDTALPAGLSASTLYWVSAPTANTLQLHYSFEEAVRGTNVVGFTDNGTGTHTIARAESAESLFADMKEGHSAERIRGETDVDNL